MNVLWGQKPRMTLINRSPRWSLCESGAIALLQRPVSSYFNNWLNVSQLDLLLQQGQSEAFLGA